MQNLPITPYLDDICTSLKNSPSRFLILTAQTAAGKSTAVPGALLQAFPGKILMLEPRRLAVLAIASRVSELLGEQIGQTAGYRMHLDSCVSSKTRFEVITEAILTRKLQADPSLEGTDVVVIDEFHERSIHADLALAFLKEAMLLRDNLYVIVMSATIDTQPLAAFLGTGSIPAPVFRVPGRQFPVAIEYAGIMNPSLAVLHELQKKITEPENNSILVFLPGIGDIRNCQQELIEQKADADILLLHSSIDFTEQQKVLEMPRPGAKRRVILSSAIAETSLTVPGVTTVIDSGLSRINRLIVSAGMEKLVTEKESIFSAEQRAGRAGRTSPGRCIRLWNENDAHILQTQPEILRTDLTALVLECIQWGVSTPEKLQWLTPPSAAAWNAALHLLQQMNCITLQNDGLASITRQGKAVLKLGLSPRLACTALYSVQTALRYSTYKDASSFLQKKFCSDTERRIKNLNSAPDEFRTDTLPIAKNTAALLAGFPDRLAHKTDSPDVYQFPSGRLASLPEHTQKPLGAAWIIAPDVSAGEKSGKIYAYEFVSENDITLWLSKSGRTTEKTDVFFSENKTLRKIACQCYGKIILSEKRLTNITQSDYAQAVCNAVTENGFSWLPLNDDITRFLLRTRFYAQQKNSEIPQEKSLAQNVQEWLPPFITGTKITAQIVYDALRWYFPSQEIDKNVPQQIVLPTGRHCKITYEEHQKKIAQKTDGASTDSKNEITGTITYIQPVLEIIIQQIFGCFETPKILGMPVLLKLLSPARRPLQITDDLEGFWQGAWKEICKEMKGRYPKHNWEYKQKTEE